MLRKGLNFNGWANRYNTRLQFTPDGKGLIFQHAIDYSTYKSFLFEFDKKSKTNKAVLAEPNFLLCTDEQLKLMLTNVTGKKLSPGHYTTNYTALLDENGKQVDSIPLMFNNACFISKTLVFGLAADSMYVYERNKGIVKRKPHVKNDYLYYGNLSYSAGKIYQTCMHKDGGFDPTTQLLQIINTDDLSEKHVKLPGKYTTLQIEAMPSGYLWLMGTGGSITDQKSFALCYNPRTEKIIREYQINGYIIDWIPSKIDEKLYACSSTSWVIDSLGVQRLENIIPGTNYKIAKNISVQPNTGLLAFYYGNEKNLIIYNSLNKKIEQQFTFNSASPLANEVIDMQWHPTKRMLAFGTKYQSDSISIGVISLSEVAIQNKPPTAVTQATIVQPPGIVLQDTHNLRASAIAFNKDGSWMVSGDLTGRVNVWDAKSKLIYNKIFLGGSGDNKFTSNSRLQLTIHPTQRKFAVNFFKDYVSILDFDDNELDKITIDGFCKLLRFTTDGRYLIMATYSRPGTLLKYDIAQKRIIDTYINAEFGTGGMLGANVFYDNQYYYDTENNKLLKINLLNGKIELKVPVKANQKIVLVDVSPDERSAIIVSEYMEMMYIDISSGQTAIISKAAIRPMGTFELNPNGGDPINIPMLHMVKVKPDNSGFIFAIEIATPRQRLMKQVGFITTPFNRSTLKLGEPFAYQQPLRNSPVVSNQMQPGTDYLWTGNEDGSLYLWDLKLEKQAAIFGGDSRMPKLIEANKYMDGLTMTVNSRRSSINYGLRQDFMRFDFATAEALSLTRSGYSTEFIYTLPDKNLLTNSANELVTVNLQSKQETVNKNFFSKDGGLEFSDVHLLYAGKKNLCYYFEKDQTLQWFENGKQVKQAKFPDDFPLKGKHRFEMDKWSFNSDSSVLYARFSYSQFDDEGRTQTGSAASFHSYNMKTSAIKRLTVPAELKTAHRLTISGDNALFAIDKQLFRYNFNSQKLDSVNSAKPALRFGTEYSSDGLFSNDKYAAAVYEHDTLRTFHQEFIRAVIINTQTLKPVADFPLKYSKVNNITFSRDNKLIYVQYAGEVEIRAIPNGSLMATLVILPGNKFIIYTPDNYYYASSKLTDIGFRTKGKVYSVEQFDLKYNRPDIVLKRLGYAPAQLIDLYRKAYLKRLQRLNFTEEGVNNESEPPTIELLNRSAIPVKTTASTVTLKLKCTTPLGTLDKISISVNDVPVYGIKGFRIPGNNLSTYTNEIEVKLMSGINRISYSVYNSTGSQSLKENIEVIHEPTTPVKPKVYFAGIGVSAYKDTRMNLKYADKDIRDISDMVKARYPDADVINLLNTDATVANIKLLKQKFMQTGVDDIIIISVSGHGLLNASGDFFYAAYETNFTNPDVTALAYKDIEWLLDGVPARKKLVMIDACHSGESDKINQSETTMLAANVKSTLTPGAKGFGKTVTKQTGVQNSFSLMQNLFMDLNEGSGAVVISAAAGDSFALESPQWNNGVFTYSVISGLKNREADRDNNKTISLSELRQYVYEKVSKETGGRQQPTTREENLGFDWQIW
ncbi:caspase family protein [Mucilaginibacter limnophilus]|nr:caspase family protein [Mucilaginibacter limnophilus]